MKHALGGRAVLSESHADALGGVPSSPVATPSAHGPRTTMDYRRQACEWRCEWRRQIVITQEDEDALWAVAFDTTPRTFDSIMQHVQTLPDFSWTFNFYRLVNLRTGQIVMLTSW